MFIKKEYKDLEKKLLEKHERKNDNEAVLEEEDFKDGSLTIFGYDRLKQQCDYIPYSEEIKIKIPKRYETGFKEKLEFLGASELNKLKEDRKGVRIASLVLMLLGIILFGVATVIENFTSDSNIFFYVTIIVSWVFIWAAVEKWFFDRRDLREKRKSLLQILSSRIIIIESGKK